MFIKNRLYTAIGNKIISYGCFYMIDEEAVPVHGKSNLRLFKAERHYESEGRCLRLTQSENEVKKEDIMKFTYCTILVF